MIESSGSQTCIVGQWHTLAAPTTAGTRVLEVDLSTLANGDTVEIATWSKAHATSAMVKAYTATYSHAQAEPLQYSTPITVGTSAVFMIKQTAGTARTFSWSVENVDGDTSTTSLFYDDFNRADSATLGANWTNITNSPKIVSNSVLGTTANAQNLAAWSTPCATDDNFAQATLLGGQSYPSIFCRGSNSEFTHYAMVRDLTNIRLRRMVAGVTTTLASYTYTPVPGDVYAISAVGSVITAYLNGAQIMQAVDTGITSGKYVGLNVYNNAAGANVDNWVGGDVNAVWSPTYVGGCTLWLDASDTTTIASSGSAVTEWRDKSDRSRALAIHATYTGVATGTRAINSLNALDFNGAGILGRLSSPINNETNGSWTAFAVAICDNITLGGSILDSDATPRVSQNLVIGAGGGAASIGFTTGGTPVTDWGPSVSNGTAYLFRSVNTGTSVEMFVDGSSNGGATAMTDQLYSSTADLAVGAMNFPNPAQFINGAIGEVIAYARVLSASEIAQVESYLAAKWGTA